MDIIAAISGQSPGIALAIVCMFFYNRLVLDFLRERKEMIENVRAERKEWVETLRESNRQYNELMRLSVEAMTYMKSEMHALRNKLTDAMLQWGIKNQDKKPNE